MFNNGFGNGFGGNSFNTAANNFKTGNIAGVNHRPSNVAGVQNHSGPVAGQQQAFQKQDPFANVHRDNSGPAKQIMNSQGQNMIHNDFRGIKN